MKKGFTLIELLAVIVILAIIAIIAIPIIINIINNAKESSNLRSAEFYLDGVTLAISRTNLKDKLTSLTCDVQSNGNLNCLEYEEEIVIDINNSKATSGSIVYDNGKFVSIENLEINGETFIMDENGKLKKGYIDNTYEANIVVDGINTNTISANKKKSYDFYVSNTGLEYREHGTQDYQIIWTYSGNDTFMGFDSHNICSSFTLVDISNLNLTSVAQTISVQIDSKYGNRFWFINNNNLINNYNIHVTDDQVHWYDESGNYLNDGMSIMVIDTMPSSADASFSYNSVCEPDIRIVLK